MIAVIKNSFYFNESIDETGSGGTGLETFKEGDF